jgi:hypothetical protein
MRNPPPDVAMVDPASGRPTKDWYDRLTYLNGLQPLSDIVFPPPDDTKSDVLRAINEQTGTSYTFALTDSGKYCRFTNSSAVSVTVPINASVAFQVGTQIDVIQGGAGKVTLSGSGVTINSLNGNKSLLNRYAGATLIKRATDEWDLVGSLTA